MDFQQNQPSWFRFMVILFVLLTLDDQLLLVNGLNCPACMYLQDSPTPCPILPCNSEQDYRASSAALIVGIGPLIATNLAQDPSSVLHRSGRAGTDSPPNNPATGPYYCFKVAGKSKIQWKLEDVGEELENVIASGCSRGTKYSPQEDVYSISDDDDEPPELSAGFVFTGKLYTCDGKIGGGPNCGEKSGVGGPASAPEPERDTSKEPGLHCDACLYKEGSRKPKCKSVPCKTEEDYLRSGGIVFTDYMKFIGETYQHQSEASVESRARKSSKPKASPSRRQGAGEDPFYCFSFTGKVSDNLLFYNFAGAGETRVVASGCSTPYEQKPYEPRLEPYKEKSFKTTSFLTFDGEGYICNETVGIGPHCSPTQRGGPPSGAGSKGEEGKGKPNKTNSTGTKSTLTGPGGGTGDGVKVLHFNLVILFGLFGSKMCKIL